MTEQKCFVFRFADVEVRERELLVMKAGRTLPVEPRAFRVLLYLLHNPQKLITKDELLDAVWGNVSVSENSGARAIAQLRRLLGDDVHAQRFIATVATVGYRFVCPVDVVEEGADEAAGPVPVPGSTGTAGPTQRLTLRKLRQLAIIAAILLITAIAAGSYFAWNKWSRPQVQVLQPVPFNGLPGNAYPTSFSPDGQMIAFNWDQNKPWPSWDVFVQMVGGGRPLQITHYSGWGAAGVWSPDGKSIALIKWSLSKGEPNEIVLVPALGGHEVILEHNHFPNWLASATLSWFPDGRRLAFTDAVSGKSTLFLLRLDDLVRTQLTSPPGTTEDSTPAVSPDGKEVAFVRTLSAGVNQVAVLSVDSGRIRVLSTETGGIWWLAWDEKGSNIIYASDKSGTYRLWRIPSGGGEAWPIDVGDDAVNPVISARSNRLAYSRVFGYNHIWRARLGAGSTDNEHPIELITSSRREDQPQFSPDNSRIAFISDRSGAPEVWVCDSDGSDPVQLTHMATRVTGSPHWSPDGQQIAFDSWVLGHSEIYVVDLHGGAPRQISHGTEDNHLPTWSSDGKWIYYTSEDPGGQLWKIPVQGGQPVQVTQHSGGLAVESADGIELYFLGPTDDNEIWRKRLPDGEERRFAGIPELRAWNDWQVTNKGIYFIAARTQSQPQSKSAGSSEPPYDLEFFDFSSGHTNTIAKLVLAKWKWGASGISVSRDGHAVLYPHTESIRSEIMLVDNFH